MSGATAIRGTTIVGVRHNGIFAIAGDGQVTLGQQTVLKRTASKIRRLYHGQVLSGFAGSTSDAITLNERFERKLEEHNGNLRRAAVELSKDWRSDRVLRRLEALMIVADASESLLINGGGDVIAPDDGLLAIGSGGSYALSAARALVRFAPHLEAGPIARESLRIAAELCVYTNDHIQLETLP